MGRRKDNGKWTNPGGHANDGEAPINAGIRELKEEAGVELTQDRFYHLDTRVVTKPSGEQLKIVAYKVNLDDVNTTIKNDPDDEVYRWHWVSIKPPLNQKIFGNLHVPVDNVILDSLGVQMEKKAFFLGFEKRADEMDMSGPAPSKEVVRSFLSKNPNPSDDDVHDFSEEKGYNNHKTEQKIYELATKQVKESTMRKEAFFSGFGKRAEEMVRGGVADGKPASKYPADQIKKGIEIEFEHTNDRDLAREIAKDHLEENKQYYTHLEKMEKEMDKAGSEDLPYQQRKDKRGPEYWGSHILAESETIRE